MKNKVKSIIFGMLRKRGIGVYKTPQAAPRLTYQTLKRFRYFSEMMDRIESVTGDIVECGVGHGKSLFFLVCLSKMENRGRKIWGFDSFEGFPSPTQQDESIRKSVAGEWGRTSVALVEDIVTSGGIDTDYVRSNLTLIPGFFEASLDKYRGDGIALLHVDCDLYESTKEVLRQLYERIVPGGVVLFDEYLGLDHIKFPGPQQAIDEFFGDQKSNFKRDEATGKYYFVKP